jgi:hypothetical protein
MTLVYSGRELSTIFTSVTYLSESLAIMIYTCNEGGSQIRHDTCLACVIPLYRCDKSPARALQYPGHDHCLCVPDWIRVCATSGLNVNGHAPQPVLYHSIFNPITNTPLPHPSSNGRRSYTKKRRCTRRSNSNITKYHFQPLFNIRYRPFHPFI